MTFIEDPRFISQKVNAYCKVFYKIEECAYYDDTSFISKIKWWGIRSTSAYSIIDKSNSTIWAEENNYIPCKWERLYYSLEPSGFIWKNSNCITCYLLVYKYTSATIPYQKILKGRHKYRIPSIWWLCNLLMMMPNTLRCLKTEQTILHVDD